MKSSIPAYFAVAIAVNVILSLSVDEAVAEGKAQSARGALSALAQQKGAHYLGRVLMVEGRYGYHQPKAWRVLALDPQIQGRVREFMISGDQIDSERALLAWKQSRRVPLREVTVDSSDAFLQADLAAKDAKVGFDSLDYQLIMPAGGKEPLWLVTLVGKSGDAVGEVQVGAKTGVVLRKAWPKPSAPAPVAQRQQEQQVRVKQVSPRKKPRPPAAVQTARRPVRDNTGVSRAAGPSRLASTKKPEPRRQPVQRPARATATPTDTASIGEASGQILEGARQGILRTSGNVREFFKALQEK